MKVTADTVLGMARLARLGLSEDEASARAGDLARILELFQSLAEIDTDAVEPMAHPLELSQRLRPDEVSEPDQRRALQAIAPEVSDGLYVVPKVIE